MYNVSTPTFFKRILSKFIMPTIFSSKKISSTYETNSFVVYDNIYHMFLLLDEKLKKEIKWKHSTIGEEDKNKPTDGV